METAAPVEPSRRRFGDLIAPLSPDEFFERFWERRPLHVRAPREAGPLLFMLDDLDRLLAQMPPPATVKLAQASDDESGSQPAAAGAAELSDLYRSYDAGLTIIVDGMHALWQPIGELCRALTAELRMQVQANLYVTPPRAKGFPCHWDGHDVLILQLDGSKAWSVCAREVPLPHPRSEGGAHESACDPELEVTLRPGDVLYIPRGAPHQGATSHEPSVHLTVGLHPATWADLLVAAIESLAASDPELHRSLPRGWPDAAMWRALVERLGEGEHVVQGLALLASQVAERAPSLPDGHFRRLGELDRITVDSLVARQSGALLHASRRDGDAKLAFPGSSVTGPAKLFWAFEFIAGAERFRVGDIPGWYSDAERVRLARVLVRAGCLRVEPT